MAIVRVIISISCFLLLIPSVHPSDITNAVFGDQLDVLPAAFGDFNSDEYPDLFVIRNNRKTVEVLLGSDTEPLVRRGGLKCDYKHEVSSIVPGDFDGDALMDILITLKVAENTSLNLVNILWGGGDTLDCNQTEKIYLTLVGQPLALDYNQDMIIDLFGETVHGERAFWVFGKQREKPEKILMPDGRTINRHFDKLRVPHSHSFLDLNGDSAADLYITTEHNFEVWIKRKDVHEGFEHDPNCTIALPTDATVVGQTLFLDMELKGKIDHVLPVCFDSHCLNSTIYVYSNGKWHNLKINFHFNGNVWGFVPPRHSSNLFTDAITLRGGDFNLDGYPDVLATLQSNGISKSFLLVNEACVSPANCNEFNRTFTVSWSALDPVNNNTVMGVFYDFMQDGILDIIFVHGNIPSSARKANVSAFKNSLDYDANFVKVMVLTGLKDKKQPVIPGPLGRKNRTFGTNLPGPIISYHTTTQEGLSRAAVCPQLPQSAYFSLNLPYTLFGLGRTPNFLETLNVGLSGYSRQWTQIIPNSQMVVIPLQLTDPSLWIARLFVTPSKLIVKSFVALLATCLLISLIIGILYWKERREDHYEKRQEAHRFHFDGM